MQTKRIAMVLVAVLAVTACGGNGDSGSAGGSSETVKVAVLDAQSGRLSTLGAETARGSTMAMEEINDAGGFEVDGTTYEFDYEATDLQSDPAVAAQVAQQAVRGFGAKIVLGPTPSALAEPVVSVVQRAEGEVLMLSAATVIDQYAGKGDPFFRSSPPDDRTAGQYIRALREEFPDIESVSALLINDALGESILDIYPPVFEENGFEVLSEDTFPPDESNFAPLMQRAPADTDAFFIGYTDPVTTSIVNSAIEAGRSTTFFTRGPFCATGVEFGDRIDLYTCIIYTDDALNPSTEKAEEFFASYAERFDIELDSNSAQALYYYDYVYMLVQAMEDAGTTEDVEAISDELRGSSYEGVITVGFDEDGVNENLIKIGIVEGGETRVIDGIAE